MRKPFFLSPLLFLTLSCAGDSGPSASRPDIVLITVDTLRADHLSCYGYTALETPAIDRLAADGVLFEQAVTPVPLTLPAHASLFTGTYPHYHGVRDNSGFVLPEEQVSLAEVLRQQGYRTGAFLGAFVLDARFGLDQGFDSYGPAFETGGPGPQMSMPQRLAREVVSDALAWIEQPGPLPFFAWLHLFDPHRPYEAPAGFASPGRSAYDAEVAYVDRALEELFGRLQERNRYRDALIVLTADHGEGLGEHGEDTHGMFLYDSTLRVPLIFKLPGNEARGARIARAVRLIDVMPTITGVLDLATPPPVQGTNLGRAWKGESLADLPAYAETLLPGLNYGWSNIYAYRTADHKYILAPRPELYDLSRDPQETENRFRGNQALANRLGRELRHVSARFSGPGAHQARRAPEQGTLEALRSLGYAAPAGPAPLPAAEGEGADPKDRIETFNLVWRAQALTASGDYRRSAGMLETVLAREPSLFMAHSIQSLNQLELGNLPAALRHLRHCARLRPEDAGSHLYLGRALLQAGRLDAAGAAFERVLELEPESRAAANNLGAVYIRQKKFAPAAGVFRSLIRSDARDEAAHLNLGLVTMLEGDSEAARVWFEQALALNPDLPEAHNNLGLIDLEAGRTAAAVSRFRKAIGLRPGYASAHYNLSRAYRLQGRIGEAEQALETARSLQGARP